MIFVYDDIIMA